MTDKPIIFAAPMVRALLDGRKTQTRRILKPQPWKKERESDPDFDGWQTHHAFQHKAQSGQLKSAHGIGTKLWVRESFQMLSFGDYQVTKSLKSDYRYKADESHGEITPEDRGYPFRPSIHMPRALSRLTLTVTDVRVQRLQDITSDDAEAEGLLCGETDGGDLVWSGVHQSYPIPEENCSHWPEEAFAELWSSINGPEAWEQNPWVVAYTFTVEKRNIDQ